jgi:hypothetical protein
MSCTVFGYYLFFMIQQPGTNIFIGYRSVLKVVLHSTGLYAVRLPAARKKLVRRQKMKLFLEEKSLIQI